MAGKSLVSRIIDREIPARIVYEDDLCIAFRDIAPQAPVHILLAPKKPIAKVADADVTDQALLGHLLLKVGDIARAENCGDAFRLIVNNGAAVGQSIFHLHIHILGGRAMGWPPG